VKRRQILAIAALPTLLSLSAFSMPAYAASTPTQILQYGASGQAVTLLQTMLNQAGYSVGTSTSKFDTRTLEEVKAFQQAHHLTVDGVVGQMTWAALQAADAAKAKSQTKSSITTPVPNVKMNITVAGQTKWAPSGFVDNETAYLPLWYVQQALVKIGVQNTWDGAVWNLTPPPGATVNLNQIQAGSGSKTISIQGKAIYHIDSITAVDPSSGVKTTYMPIWYVIQVLNRMGITSTWGNQTWNLPGLTDTSAGSGSEPGSGSGAGQSSSGGTASGPGTTGATGTTTTGGSLSGLGASSPTSTNTAVPIANLKLHITVADKGFSNPSGFVYNGTTYMPLWYIQQALEKIGIHSTWNDKTWDLTPPASIKVNLNNIQAGSGSKSISIQSQVIYQVNPIVAIDPNSNGETTYMPIWYVIQVLNRLGISSTWSNQTWNLPALSGQGSGTSGSGSSTGSTSGSTGTGTSGSSGSSSSGTGTSGSTSSSGTTPPPVPVANVSAHVTVSGQHFSDPSGFVYNGTMYMPIWYVMQALNKIGVQNTWDQITWNMIPPANAQVNLTNIQAGSGSKSIAILGTVVTHVNSIVAADPNTGNGTTYMPIWYVMQALNRMGLSTTWSNQTWNLPNWPSQGSTGTGTGTGGSTGTGTGGSGTGTGSTGSGSTGSGSGGSTSGNASFTNVDLRFSAPVNINAATIDSFLAAHPSPLTGLGFSFMNAQTIYGVDANYLVSQAILESGWGKSSIAQVKNNLFGYGAYDANPGNDAGTFPSDDYAIRFQAWMLRQSYLAPGSRLYVTPTLTGLGVHYATDPHYASSIGSIMNEFAGAEGDSVTSYTQYSSTVSAPAPQSSVEPTYYYNGAQASVIGSQYYNNGLPYYSDMISGENDMFYGTLQIGSMGSNVKSLQTYLNQQIGAGLTVDGDFGQMTANAVKAYQTQHNLSVTGVWDFSLWQLIAPTSTNTPTIPAGTTVSIDKMMQGMANGFVTEWDHVVGFGWVDAHYIALQNVYQAKAVSPLSTQTTIHVYNVANPSQVVTTLHSGDYVVCLNPTAAGGMYSIQIANEITGQPIAGLISAAEASLVQVPPPNQS
jgi:mannosyl-glycoprotein endo-beta-N-acetylglucosaminidase